VIYLAEMKSVQVTECTQKHVNSNASKQTEKPVRYLGIAGPACVKY